MDNNLFASEVDYQASLSIAEGLFRANLLTDGEFMHAKALLLQKYHPPIGTLLAGVG